MNNRAQPNSLAEHRQPAHADAGLTHAQQQHAQVFSLEGKLALVTGGGTGIGLEIARCMAQAGATVVITGRREAVLREAVTALGETAEYIVNDITDLSSI